MSEEVDQQIPVAVPDRNQEQLLEEEKARLEELRVQAEERKKAEEEARIKAEKDLKKLQEALKTSLSGLAKTANNRSMAYNRLSLAEKQLQRLFPVLLRYQEIRYLDLSSNTISDLTVALGLGQLVTLNASKNQVSSLECFQNNKMQHLQVLNLSGNKIKTLTVLQLPSLRRLNLSQNQITEITWKGSNSIIILELRKNKLRKLKGIANMKSLQELYVA